MLRKTPVLFLYHKTRRISREKTTAAGSVTVDGGTYTSNGLGSPAIYSTADITVSNATLVSTLSEGVCIEGLNSITLNHCDLTANNTKCNGNATFLDTIMIYQSMSGDAASGAALTGTK